MKWFVNYVFVYSPINAKAKELGEWVNSRKQTLMSDDLSKDAFIEEVKLLVLALNKKYPHTKPFCIQSQTIDKFGTIDVSFSIQDDIKTVAYLRIAKVLKEYHFCERIERKEVSND